MSSFTWGSYKPTTELPSDEKFGLIIQMRRAALSVHLNIAQGSSRRSTIDHSPFTIHHSLKKLRLATN